MDFDLTKEQQQLGDSIQRFVAREYAFEKRKGILRSEEGMSREVWAHLAEMGLLALQVPEEHGGMGGAPIETMLAMNGVGRGLLLEPYLASAVVATTLLRELGSPAQQGELFPAMAAGERIVVLAHDEPGARYDLTQVSTKATRAGDGYALSGQKSVVVHAPSADLLLVSARTGSGVSLFLVPWDAKGVSLAAYRTLDGRRAADVTLSEVRAGREALVGAEGAALDVIVSVNDVAIAAACAEAVGALEALLQTTVEYSKSRKQFGVPIGTFQALQHRMVEMLIHVEQAKSMSYLASLRSDEKDLQARARVMSAAKVIVGRACRNVGQEAVQIHGGMGMTEEFHASHYFRRLAALELSFGDTEHHLEKFALNSAEAT
ncbi:MAG: acyl-CoA dehydrogenase [Deltaproteobacteria bacterium]|nr:MAG: acyl-CoA dehydrogenase [Deltaproteobacteria bacterium]